MFSRAKRIAAIPVRTFFGMGELTVTIQKRLFLSNILMLIIPVLVEQSKEFLCSTEDLSHSKLYYTAEKYLVS